MLIDQKALDTLLAANPNLSANGFLSEPTDTPNVDREQVDLAIRWLDHHGRRASINPDYSSYGLKHSAEKTAPALRRGAVPYIANGAFIAAALYLNYKITRIRDTPNVRINIRFDKKSQAKLLEKVAK